MPVLQKLKDAYILWHSYRQILPRTHRHTLGERIDNLFIQSIELSTSAAFSSKEEKLSHVKIAIRKIDTLKILLMILWETKSLDDKKYLALSDKMDEVGRMLGGWQGQLIKQNSPNKSGEK